MPTPDRTSLGQIVDAGSAILEYGGPAKLTMQAVAERVGVRAPSLYKRVRDRDALLNLVAGATADDLAARLAVSDGSLAGLARAYRSFAQDRPEGFRLMFAVDGAADAMARASDPVLRRRANWWGRMPRSTPLAWSPRGQPVSSTWNCPDRSASKATSTGRSTTGSRGFRPACVRGDDALRRNTRYGSVMAIEGRITSRSGCQYS